MTIIEVGAYSERQYQKQDGSSEYFKSRGVTMKRGGDVIYGEMTGELASKNRDAQFQQGLPYIVKGFWKHRTWGDNNDRHERVVCQLENGWLKETPQRYKFFNSVRKDLGRRLVDVVMHRELNAAMQVLEVEEILDRV